MGTRGGREAERKGQLREEAERQRVEAGDRGREGKRKEARMKEKREVDLSI